VSALKHFGTSFIFRNISCHGHIGKNLSTISLNRILKDRAWREDQPRPQIDKISGHATRVGYAQDLIKCGATLPQIMPAGHCKSNSTAERYKEHTGLTEIINLRI